MLICPGTGKTLLEYLETINIEEGEDEQGMILPVQSVSAKS